MKKLLFFLCICIFILSCALAESPEWTYSWNHDGIGRYNGPGGDVTVPETAEDTVVHTVGDAVFARNSTITSLTVPGHIRSLGGGAINGCDNLERVTLAEGLQAIEYNNFSFLPKLTEVTIPSTVALIDYSFSWCDNLRKVTFLGACPIFSHPDFCFDVLPDDLTVYVPDDQVEAYRAALINLNPDQIQPSGQQAIIHDYVPTAEELGFDNGVITAYYGDSLRVDLPGEVNGVAVTAIGASAFADSPIVAVTIPEGVTEIGTSAFDGADDLHVINLPDSLKVIGDHAFNSTEANMITWGSGLEEIGDGAFRYVSFGEDLELPESLRVIGPEAFKGATLRNVHIGSNIQSIGANAFNRTNLNYLQLDVYDMIEVGEDAFSGTWLEDVDLPWDSDQQNQLAWQALIDSQVEGCKVWINNPVDCELPVSGNYTYGEYPDGTLYLESYSSDQETLVLYHTMDGVQITGIGDGALKGNQTLKKYRVTHNDTFKTIGAEAFADSAVETVDLYYTTETLGDGAFRNCVNLTAIVLPESLKSVGHGAFAGCVNLQDVTILCDPAIIPEDAFEGTAYAQVPIIEMSFAANAESDFDFDPETGAIREYLGDSVDVVIPAAIGGVPVKVISYNAFDRARDYTDTDMVSNRTAWLPLRSVVIPETVEVIEDSAFSYCQQLELVICYAPLESTGRGTFMLCRRLKDVIFVNGVKVLDNYVFDSCESLEHVFWSGKLRRIGVSAFVLSGIRAFIVDAEIVDEQAFYRSALESVVLTDRVKEVHAAAFAQCENLSSFACQFSDADRFVDGGPTGGIPETGVTTVFPETTTADELNALNRKFNIWNGGHLGNGNEITLGAIESAAAELPDVEALRQQVVSQPAPTLPEPEPEPEIVLPEPIGDAEKALGTWEMVAMVEAGEEIDISGFGLEMFLTLSADGSAVMDMSGDVKNLGWELDDSGILWIGAEDEYLPVGLDENGRLILTEGSGSMIYVRTEGAATIPETEPKAPAELEDISQFLGDWTLTAMVEKGQEVDVSLFGLVMDISLREDGSVEVCTEDGVQTMPWFIRDGALWIGSDGDEEPASLDDQGRLALLSGDATILFSRREEAPAVDLGFDLTPYLGEWHCVWVDTIVMQYNPEKDETGSPMILTVYPDGTAYFDADDRSGSLELGEYGVVFFGGQAMTLLEDDQFLRLGDGMYFSHDRDAEVPDRYRHVKQDEMDVFLASIPATPAPDAPAPVAPGELRMDVKYLATSYAAGGYSFDAAMLGAEYSATFHADGSCRFVMGGYEVPGVTWSAEGDTILINYALGYPCTLNGDALELDFSGAMLLHMEPQL